jgi:hypothetical protein
VALISPARGVPCQSGNGEPLTEPQVGSSSIWSAASLWILAIVSHPEKSYAEIAKAFDIWYTRVAQIATKYNVNRPRGRRLAKIF